MEFQLAGYSPIKASIGDTSASLHTFPEWWKQTTYRPLLSTQLLHGFGHSTGTEADEAIVDDAANHGFVCETESVLVAS